MNQEGLQEHGEVSVYNRGYGYLPPLLRREMGIGEGTGKIPFFVDAKIAVLIRSDTEKGDVI